MNLPKIIYIVRQNEGTEDEYLQAELTDEEFAEIGKKTPVGKYRLEETYSVTAQRVVERKKA